MRDFASSTLQFFSTDFLRCGFAGRPGLAGFHLTLEPVDLVLDGLPSRLSCEPIQRTVPLFLTEHRRSGQSLVKRHLLFGWRIGARPPHCLGAVVCSTGRCRHLTASSHARWERKCPGSTGDGTGLSFYDPGLTRLARRRHYLSADIAWYQTKPRIPRRLHGTVLVPVRIELGSPPRHHVLTGENLPDEFPDLRLVEVLRHPAQIVPAFVAVQQLAICLASIFSAGNLGIEVQRNGIIVKGLALDPDHLIETDILTRG